MPHTIVGFDPGDFRRVGDATRRSEGAIQGQLHPTPDPLTFIPEQTVMEVDVVITGPKRTDVLPNKQNGDPTPAYPAIIVYRNIYKDSLGDEDWIETDAVMVFDINDNDLEEERRYRGWVYGTVVWTSTESGSGSGMSNRSVIVKVNAYEQGTQDDSGSGGGDGCTDKPGVCPVWYTGYGQLESCVVSPGQKLKPGALIGRISGNATRARSHFSLGDGRDFFKPKPLSVCGTALNIDDLIPGVHTGIRTGIRPANYPPNFGVGETQVGSAISYIRSVFRFWLVGESWEINVGSSDLKEDEYYAVDAYPIQPDVELPEEVAAVLESFGGDPVYNAIKDGADVESVVLYAQSLGAESGFTVIVKHTRKCCTGRTVDSGSGDSGSSSGSGGGGGDENPLKHENKLSVTTAVCLALPPMIESGSGGSGSTSGDSSPSYDGVDDETSQAIAEWVVRQVANEGWDGTKFPLALKQKNATLFLPIGTNYTMDSCTYSKGCDELCSGDNSGTGAGGEYCYYIFLAPIGERLDFQEYDENGNPYWANDNMELYFDVGMAVWVFQDFGVYGYQQWIADEDPGWRPVGTSGHFAPAPGFDGFYLDEFTASCMPSDESGGGLDECESPLPNMKVSMSAPVCNVQWTNAPCVFYPTVGVNSCAAYESNGGGTPGGRNGFKGFGAVLIKQANGKYTIRHANDILAPAIYAAPPTTTNIVPLSTSPLHVRLTYTADDVDCDDCIPSKSVTIDFEQV